MTDMKWSEFPKPSSETEWWFAQMVIYDFVAMLTRILAAVKKWEEIAWAEFEEWKQEIEQKRTPSSNKYEYDPISDESIMPVYTEYALYGSLAVNIVALVEDELALLFRHGATILKDGSNGKVAQKPHFGDFIFTLEKRYGCKRQDISHYGEHLFVRELANRFKHSGGNATQGFVDEFGTIAGVERADDRIPYNQYPWGCYVQQARNLLIDAAKRLADSGDKKGGQ